MFSLLVVALLSYVSLGQDCTANYVIDFSGRALSPISPTDGSCSYESFTMNGTTNATSVMYECNSNGVAVGYYYDDASCSNQVATTTFSDGYRCNASDCDIVSSSYTVSDSNCPDAAMMYDSGKGKVYAVEGICGAYSFLSVQFSSSDDCIDISVWLNPTCNNTELFSDQYCTGECANETNIYYSSSHHVSISIALIVAAFASLFM